MIQQFFKIGGVKSEKEFLAKYPTEESFFRQHPEAMDLLMNTMPFIPSYTDALTPRADYGGAMSYPNMQGQNVSIAPPILKDYPDYESWANASNQYYQMLQEQANQRPMSKKYGGLIKARVGLEVDPGKPYHPITNPDGYKTFLTDEQKREMGLPVAQRSVMYDKPIVNVPTISREQAEGYKDRQNASIGPSRTNYTRAQVKAMNAEEARRKAQANSALAQTMGSMTPQRYEDYTAPGGAGSIGAATQTIATGVPVLAAGVAGAAPSVAAGLSAPILSTPGLTVGNLLGLGFGLMGANRLGKDINSGYYNDPNISTLGKIDRGVMTGLDMTMTPGLGTAALSGMRGLSSAARQGNRAFNSAVNYATPALAELSTKLANNPGIVNSIAEAATGFARSPQEGLASLATIIPSAIRTEGQGAPKLNEAFQKLQKGEISSWVGDEWMMGSNPYGTINYRSPGTGRLHRIDYENTGYPLFSGNAPTSDAYVRTIKVKDEHPGDFPPGQMGSKALKFLIKKAPGEQLPRVDDFGFFNDIPASASDQLGLFMSRIGAGPIHLPKTGSTSIFSQPLMNSSIQRMISNAKRQHGTMENVISLEPSADIKYLNDIGSGRSVYNEKLGRDLTRAELAAQQWEKIRKTYQGLENESGVKFPITPGIEVRAQSGKQYFGDEASQFLKELVNKNMSNYDFLSDVDPSFIVPDYSLKKFKKKGGEYTGTWNGNQGFEYGGSYVPDYASNAYGLPQFGYGAPVYADGGMSPEQAMMMQQQMMAQQGAPAEQAPPQEQAPQMDQQQLVQAVAQMVQQGMPPEQVMQQLVQNGIPEQIAQQLIQMVIMQLQGGGQEQAMPEQQLGMAKGGSIKNLSVGQEMDVTEEELEELRRKGVQFKIV